MSDSKPATPAVPSAPPSTATNPELMQPQFTELEKLRKEKEILLKKLVIEKVRRERSALKEEEEKEKGEKEEEAEGEGGILLLLPLVVVLGGLGHRCRAVFFFSAPPDDRLPFLCPIS